MLADGVLKTYLDNGLAVILKETHRAPVASFWVWYRVGSRNEQVGITGISHWVEHMMFRGTEQFPAGVDDRLPSCTGTPQPPASTGADITGTQQSTAAFARSTPNS